MNILGLLDQLLQSGQSAMQNASQSTHAPAQGNPLGTLLTGAGGGALAAGTIGLLMGSKSARKIGSKALTYGGLAAIGVVATARGVSAIITAPANRRLHAVEPNLIPIVCPLC